MNRVFLSLGSNLGNRDANLRAGLAALAECGRIVRVSSFVETRAWGNENQPDFLNAAAEYQTDLSPEELLDRIKEIERTAGRDFSSPRWSPRPLDVDILWYGDQQMNSDRLTIPHSRMLEREFVLAPLAEIAPLAIVPGTGLTCADHLARLRREPCPAAR